MTHPSDDELEAIAARLSVKNGYAAPDFATPIAEPLKLEAAALLRACKGRVRVKPGEIERSVWSAMKWAAENNPGFDGVPEYTDRGNSFAETECRAAAARILAALEPAPDQGEWNAAIEAAAEVAEYIPNGAHPSEYTAAIRALKRGPSHD